MNAGDVVINAVDGCIVAFVGSYVISLIRSPKLLDEDCAKKVAARNARIEELIPKTDPLEESRFQHVSEALSQFGPEEWQSLAWLLKAGESEFVRMSGPRAPLMAIHRVLGTALAYEILQENRLKEEGRLKYRINRVFEQALTTFLHGKGII